MEMDVNLSKLSAIELVNISASSAARTGTAMGALTLMGTATFNGNLQSGVGSQRHNSNNNNGSAERTDGTAGTVTPTSHQPPKTGCCGVLGLLLKSSRNAGRTASSSIGDYNSFGGVALAGGVSNISSISGSMRKTHQRRTPQEVYFESRGKSCKKLLKFNGSSNKILLYPEEGWARTASSSYWTITPCWWQPNRCRIEEFMGASQRRSAKAKMVPLEQKGSLLIAGNFGRSKSKNRKQPPPQQHYQHRAKEATHDDEFKLYLSSNISMEDYNMGYCLTGFVERRCQQTNTFQMTHFAVIKRQWPSISNDLKST